MISRVLILYAGCLDIQNMLIDDLPNEILVEIIDYLALRDVFVCATVSRRWRSICENSNIKELILYDNTDNCDSEWWCTKRPFNEKNMFRFTILSFLTSSRLTRLRRLAMYDDLFNRTRNFNLHCLRCFHHLYHLELTEFSKQSQQAQKTCLSLPNLAILKCTQIHCEIIFDTPALKSFYVSAGRLISFKNLSTLKLFEIDAIESQFVYNFNRIKHVEVFHTSYNKNLHRFYHFMNTLVDLKEIHWKQSKYGIYREYLKEWITTIPEQRRSLNKENVKIYIFGKLLEDDKDFESYEFDKVDGVDLINVDI